MDKPLKSVMHGQCDARPAVTFPATEHHHPLTGTKLYCLVTDAHVCEQLAQGCYLKAEWLGLEPATFWFASPTTLTITPSSRPHDITSYEAETENERRLLKTWHRRIHLWLCRIVMARCCTSIHIRWIWWPHSAHTHTYTHTQPHEVDSNPVGEFLCVYTCSHRRMNNPKT